MLSRAAIVCPHAGSASGPVTNPSLRGTRWAMTVTKLPSRAPTTNASTAMRAIGSGP